MEETIGGKTVAELVAKIEQMDLSEKAVHDLVHSLQTGQPLHPKNGSPHPKSSPVTKLTEIVRTYTCITCGSRWTHAIQLTNAESICTQDKTGKVVVITSKGPYQVDSFTRSCQRCGDYLTTLSRHELENLAYGLLQFRPLPKTSSV